MKTTLLALAATAASALAAIPATARAQAGAAVAPAATPAASASRPPLSGPWAGTLRAGPIAATLQLDFTAGADGRMGSMKLVPDGPQPPLAGEIRDVVVRDDSVSFSALTPMGTIRFTGTPDAQGALKGQLVVVGEGGTIEARGVWTAAATPSASGR